MFATFLDATYTQVHITRNDSGEILPHAASAPVRAAASSPAGLSQKALLTGIAGTALPPLEFARATHNLFC